jgi:hypothetical protein
MQQAAPHAPSDELSALRDEVAHLRAEVAGLREALLDLRQVIRVLNPVAEDYARRARAYPQINAIYYWGSAQGPHFVTLVDASEQAEIYAVYELQAELGTAHLGEPYVFDQTLTQQHLRTAGVTITDMLGDGAQLLYQRET